MSKYLSYDYYIITQIGHLGDITNTFRCYELTHLPSSNTWISRECFIFESTDETCIVEPFSSDVDVAKNIPIVDAALAYDCPFTNETYILIIHNALYIIYVDQHFTPPFIMRGGGG